MKIPWIGSKKKMLPKLLKYIPTNYNNYYEPFLGSGALFQSLAPSIVTLNDNDYQFNTTLERYVSKTRIVL
ncbi:DNA adenine methylase [Candidatus Phytoplasma australiense]|uniref:DNA adenine methylase n=1 Tax=Strawberry lethal yellows phytoplasma (CPA) str. NZSb11 TaxID=980422 RepID=R4RN15_PHYAS|nr:DNA adenine methylase [Candidatus Phytoplasma australiense]AGL90745.1 hypothetical protein SLY_0830 [Strawberry lethal yellows phytoplasma (CPA) str. NZSb11]